MYRALVTGGTRGIGRAIAAAILADGGSVDVTGRDAKDADEAARDTWKGRRAERIAGDRSCPDVRDRNAVDAAVARRSNRFGAL